MSTGPAGATGFQNAAPTPSTMYSGGGNFQPTSIGGYQPQSEGYFTARGLPQPQQPNPEGYLSTDENGNSIRVLQGGGQAPQQPTSFGGGLPGFGGLIGGGIKSNPLDPMTPPPTAPPTMTPPGMTPPTNLGGGGLLNQPPMQPPGTFPGIHEVRDYGTRMPPNVQRGIY